MTNLETVDLRLCDRWHSRSSSVPVIRFIRKDFIDDENRISVIKRKSVNVRRMEKEENQRYDVRGIRSEIYRFLSTRPRIDRSFFRRS